MTTWRWASLWLGLVVSACGDDASTVEGGGEDTAGASSAADSSSTISSSSAASSTTSTDSGASLDSSSDEAAVYFDVGGGSVDLPGSSCEDQRGNGGRPGDVELSYIWISNTVENTISKINTETMEEEARYMARPAEGDPSRTSVNLNGDVAVANRNGGVAKFWADPEHCSGANTSTGGSDVLPWDEEECRAWYHPMVCTSNRPVAWTRGEWSEHTCRFENADLWTACDQQALLLDGDTGEIEHSVALTAGAMVYGGAADGDGNFWGYDLAHLTIFRIDHADHTVLTSPTPVPAYGITVDKEGRPWICASTVARFNLDTSTWSVSNDASGGGGCMSDGESTIWHARSNMGGPNPGALLGFDIESLELVHEIPLPQYVHGISVDFAGKVWGVEMVGDQAYRADPVTLEVETFTGLVGAYTYSDMTGFALSAAGGGGVPQG